MYIYIFIASHSPKQNPKKVHYVAVALVVWCGAAKPEMKIGICFGWYLFEI